MTMKKLLKLITATLLLLILTANSQASNLTIEITEGIEGSLPIAVVPFKWTGDPASSPAHDVAQVISADLKRSGRFKPLGLEKMLARPSSGDEVDFRDWRALQMENIVVGQVQPNGSGGYLVRFQLFDVYKGEQITGYSVPTTASDLRATAHHIADIIYETLTGDPGAFATRIAYVTSVGKGKNKKISLRIADADGFNPQTIVTSSEPIMSPAWSPDGRKLAYVSFEKAKPSIFIQEVFTGQREKISSFKGINGAPAFSPDGRYLAMTLSKDGNPDIFIMDLRTRSLRKLTNHWAIDTEPAWSPDGKHLVFTSDRGGKPQIYRVAVTGGEPERMTYEGDYNARASYSPDGKDLVMVTRVNGNYRIGGLELKSKELRVLSRGALDESPSFAPNGSMVIYANTANDKGELSAVSFDGRVRQRLALQEGDVREPVWSPYNNRERSR
jgi:TolB protein